MSPNTPQIPPQAPRQGEQAPRRIEVLAFPDVQLLDVAGPVQVFAAANEQADGPGALPPYRIRVIAPEGAQIRATSGLAFLTEPLPDPAEPLDTLIVAGGQGVMRAAEDASLVDWLKLRAGAARRTASVCTGAFLLAAARPARSPPRRHALGILRPAQAPPPRCDRWSPIRFSCTTDPCGARRA